MKPHLDYDIAIIGGGVIGLSIAISLQQSGKTVIIIDQDDEQINASRKNAGVPVEENVAAHFLPIMTLFPTPEIIILPSLQLIIILIRLTSELLIFFFKFLSALISN